MDNIIYKIAHHETFGLRYPNLEERKQKLIDKVVSVIRMLSSEVKYFPDGGIYAEYYRPIDKILSGTELDQVRFDNSCSYVDIFVENQGNFETFLFWFTEFLYQAFNQNRKIPKNYIYDIRRLVQMFERLNFEYTIDIENNEVIRITDKATSEVINSNVESINTNEGEGNSEHYQDCVDDFLKLNKSNSSSSYYEALERMKKVLERSIGKNIKKNDKSAWLSKTDTILDSIFKDNKKDIDAQRKSIEFIKQSIHHDKEDVKGTPSPYKFNKSEFIYWWLEMNNFIYLLNNQ